MGIAVSSKSERRLANIELRGSEWDFRSSSEDLTIVTLLSFEVKSLQLVCGPETWEMQSAKVAPKGQKEKIWWTKIARAQLSGRHARLQVSASEKILYRFGTNASHLTDKAIVDDPRYDCLFFFSPSFAKGRLKSGSKSQQFLSFFEHFIQQPNYQRIIPQLILQYNSRKAHHSSVEKSTAFNYAERAIERTKNLSEVFCGCVLAVLGSLTLTMTGSLKPGSKLLSCINDCVLQHLSLCRNQQFVSAVFKGAAHCLFLGKRLGSELKHAAVSQLLRHEKVTVDFIDQALQDCQQLDYSKLDMWIEAIKKQKETELLVRKAMLKSTQYSSVFKLLVDFPVMSEDQSFLQSVFDKVNKPTYYYSSSSYQPPVSEIEEVLDILAQSPEHLKPVLYQSPLMERIQEKLQYPSASSISLYKRLFVTQYDFKIVGEYKKEPFLEKLCEQPDVSFAYVTNELGIEERNIETMFQKWMNGNCSTQYCSNDSSLINKLDNELQQILNKSLLPSLSKVGVEYINTKFPLDSYSLRSIAKSIDAVKTEELKCAYVFSPSVTSNLGDEPSQVSRDELLEQQKCDPESWTIKKLLEYFRYEEVESKLIGQEGIDPNWIILMRSFHNYKNYGSVVALRRAIQKFTDNVISKHLSIANFLQLITKSQKDLQEICELMETAERVDQPLYVFFQDLSIYASFQEAFHHSMAIVVKIKLLWWFSTNILSDAAERAAALEEINHIQKTYKEKLLDEFSFTARQNELCSCAEVAKAFAGSRLFRAKITEMQKVKPITIATSHAACTAAITDITTAISTLLQSLETRPVSEVLHFFAHVENWEQEICVMGEMYAEWAPKLQVLKEGLKCYQGREQLQSICQRLLDLSESLHWHDPVTVQTVQQYTQQMQNVQHIQFWQLITLYAEIYAFLYPGGVHIEPIFAVLTVLSEARELVAFLKELSVGRLFILLEHIDDCDEGTDTAELIVELKNVWQLYKGIQTAHTYKELIWKVSEEDKNALEGQVKRCSQRIRAIIEFSVEPRSDAKHRQIFQLYTKSEVAFQKQKDKYDVCVVISDRKHRQPFDLLSLQDLHAQAIHSLHAAKEDDSSLAALRSFVSFTREIQSTAEALTDLFSFGYPDDNADNRRFQCVQGSCPELSAFHTHTTSLLQTWKQCIEEAYQRCYPLTFLFGRQFWTMEEHFAGKTSAEALSLLDYMHRIYGDHQVRPAKLKPVERLVDLCRSLSQLVSSAASNMRVSYDMPTGSIKCPSKCLMYMSVARPRVLNALVSAYLHSGRPFPQAHQILYGTQQAQLAELYAFLYRCFTSPHDEMFALIEPEKLQPQLQIEVRNLFMRLVASRRYCASLVVITGEDDSLLSEYFRTLKEPKCIRVRSEQILSDERLLGNLITQINAKAYESPTIVVRSHSAGQGKSAWVRDQAGWTQGLTLCKVPIAGDLDLEVVCSQLLKMQANIALHFTLSHVNDSKALNDLITCICLFRTVGAGNLRMTIPASWKVYIEVQNLPVPLDLPILTFLQEQVISFDIRRVQLRDPIKTIVAYLRLYETNALAKGNVSAVQVTSDMAISLLTKYLIQPLIDRKRSVSYTTVQSFASTMLSQLTAMEKGSFSTESIDLMIADASMYSGHFEYESLREQLVSNLLQTCTEATTRSVAQVRSAQAKALVREIILPSHEGTFKWDDQAFEYLHTYYKVKLLVNDDSNSSYALTQDNFLKMDLIHLRVTAKLPIVIVGETGCGKTSLIRFFVQEVLSEELEVINIHSGFTSKLLALRMEEVTERAAANTTQRLWVLFDEFNTSDCVGQICEMLCERTFDGMDLPENMVLLAACNPYRMRPKAFQSEIAGIKKPAPYQNCTQSNLVYDVKPLPESVMEHVWDFGVLTENDTWRYIEAMLKQMNCERLQPMLTHLVVESHKYFTRLEDVSSVSLRDVARFVTLYQWFEASLKARNEARECDSYMRNCEKHHLHSDWSMLQDVQFCASVLALCSCYYYRLAKQVHRDRYLDAVCRASEGYLSNETVEQILRCNEDDLLARMELPEGTALNKALRENVSCLLHCILCNVALLICGEPGSSKSLAVHIVFSNLRGNKSADPYFRTLPELVMVPFQGSEFCTSEGIQKVFERAKKFLTHASFDVLPVVVFDQIGLAEISKHNPLKVLNGLLERENHVVGFVGISNWRVDASKINRAMLLTHPDPDYEQLKLTALHLLDARAQQPPLTQHADLAEALAHAYFEYKIEVMGTRCPGFFGLRDFYSMVKHTSVRLQENSVSDTGQIFLIVKQAIERNFGGKTGAAGRILALLMSFHQEFRYFEYASPTNPVELITANLNDANSRGLMLICKGDVAHVLGQRFDLLPKQGRILVKSHMRDNEEYAFRSLRDATLCMESGVPVVLDKTNHIYSALYDFLNQDFTRVGNRKYCKVALGEFFMPQCFVHNEFRLVVLTEDDEHALSQTDSSFLSRFEKQKLDCDMLFTRQHRVVYEQVLLWVDSLMNLAGNEKPLISRNHVFPLYSPDYLKLLVLSQKVEGSAGNFAVEECKQELLKMASQDVVLLALAGTMEHAEKGYIQSTWKSYHEQTFLSYFTAFSVNDEPGSFTKCIVFLYSADLPAFPSSTHYAHFSSFRDEQDLGEDLANFYRSSPTSYVLDLSMTRNGRNLAAVKRAVETTEMEMKDSRKKVCLLVRLMRNAPIDINTCWFDQWDKRTFTSLEEPDFLLVDKLARLNITDALEQPSSTYDFRAELETLTFDAYQQIPFTTEDGQSLSEINRHIFSISERIAADPVLTNVLRSKLQSLIPLKPCLNRVLCVPEAVTRASTLPEASKHAINFELVKVYPKVLYQVEQFGGFDSFLMSTQKREFLQQLWLEIFERLSWDIELPPLKPLKAGLLLDFPFVQRDFSLLKRVFSESLSCEEPKLLFFKEYSEFSLFREHFAEMLESQDLQHMYFRDLMRLDLAQNLEARKDTLLLHLIKCWICGKSTMEEKAWQYMQNRGFCFTYAEIVVSLQQLGIDCAASLNRIIAYSQQTHDIGDRRTADPVKLFLGNELEIMTSELTISSEWLKKAKSVRETASTLSKLISWMHCLGYTHDVSLEHFNETETHALCLNLLSQSEQAESCFRQLQQTIPTVTSGSFICNKAYSLKLISMIEQHCSSGDANTILSACLLALLGRDEVRYLPRVVGTINRQNSHLWKHSASLIASIARIAGLMPDPWAIVENVKQSPFANKLERLLNDKVTPKRFSVLLCDTVYWYLKKNMQFRDGREAAALVTKYYELFRHFMRKMTSGRIEHSRITDVYSSAFLRVYLEAYYEVLDSEEPSASARKVTKELNSDHLPTTRVYVLKCWRQRKGISLQALQSKLQAHPTLTSWIDPFMFPEDTSEIVPCQRQACYHRVTMWIRAVLMQSKREALSDVIRAANDISQAVEFATAVMTHAYLRLATEPESSALVSLFSAEKNLLEQQFGCAMSSLILCFVCNFPEGSCLRLRERIPEAEKQLALSLSFALITLCAHSKVGSVLTFPYLTANGNLRVCSDVVNRSFLGVGVHPKNQQMQNRLQNFDTRKQNVSGLAHIFQTLAKYKANPDKGFSTFGVGESSPQALRGISPLAHTTLHLLTTLLLRFLHLCNLLPDSELQAIIQFHDLTSSPSSSLEEEVRKDFSFIEENLGAPEDIHLWWYAMLTQFPLTLHPHIKLPIDLASRTVFESQFGAFLQPFCERSTSFVQSMREMNQSGSFSSPLEETYLEQYLPQFPSLHLFRLTQSPSLESLSQDIVRLQLKDKYPLLTLFLEKKSDIATLSLLPPLVNFTNYLRDSYRLRISRKEAHATEMSAVFRSDPRAKELFDACAEVWDWLATTSVTFECHELPKKVLSSSSKLNCFLVDKQDLDGGIYMAAALRTLAGIQNSILSCFLEIMARKLGLPLQTLLGSREVRIQQICSENVVAYSLETWHDFERCFLNNPAYGEGKHIEYNFPRMEESVQKRLQSGRFLGSQLDYICYTYERLNSASPHSTLIERIRSVIPQQPLSTQKVAEVQEFLTDLCTREQLTELYESLSSLLCVLENSRVEPCARLLEFAQGRNALVSEAFTEPTPVAQVELWHIVPLYELIESKVFPFFVESAMLPQYKMDVLQSDSLEALQCRLKSCANRSLAELQLAVMRMSLRMLTVDLEQSQAISLYVIRPDLWQEEYTEEQRKELAAVLGCVSLANTKLVYELMDRQAKENNQQKEQVAKPSPAPTKKVRRGR